MCSCFPSHHWSIWFEGTVWQVFLRLWIDVLLRNAIYASVFCLSQSRLDNFDAVTTPIQATIRSHSQDDAATISWNTGNFFRANESRSRSFLAHARDIFSSRVRLCHRLILKVVMTTYSQIALMIWSSIHIGYPLFVQTILVPRLKNYVINRVWSLDYALELTLSMSSSYIDVLVPNFLKCVFLRSLYSHKRFGICFLL
jgi:hypothetical protein